MARGLLCLLAVLGTLASAACSQRSLGELCPPAEAAVALQPSRHPARPDAGPLTIYWDGSESLAGYADGATPTLRILGDLQPLLSGLAEDRGGPSHWLRFGETISPLEAPRAVAEAQFYRCRGCDKLESRIDTVLNRISEHRGGLDVVVTDFWLTNSSFEGTSDVALGQPIRQIMRQGRSIGLIGLKAPYSGPVFDVPHVGSYRGAHERALFIMLVGERQEVLRAHRRLEDSGSAALKDMKFALFTPEPAASWLGASPALSRRGVEPLRLVDGGAAASLPQLRWSLEDMRTGRARLEARIDPQARLLPGAVWRGKLIGTTHVWRRGSPGGCERPRWIAEPALSGAWRAKAGEDHHLSFVLDQASTKGLIAGRDYLIQGDLTAGPPQSGAPETRWMRDWNLDPDKAAATAAAKPEFFPTLNLAALADQLDASLRDITPATGRPLATLAIVARVSP